MSSVPTLGYWDIRGRAEPIRYLLRYAGVKLNDKRYPVGAVSSEPGRKPWSADKYSLGLDFPNIPYYIDGDFKLTQSLAILRYLARKHGLIATKDPELARQELAEQQIVDYKVIFTGIAFAADFKEKKPAYITDTLVPQLEAFTKFLGSNQWLTSKFSYVDILAYETLDRIRLFTPETFEKFPIIVQYLKRFEELPPIKEYRNSSAYKDWPIFGPIGKWGWIK